MTIFSEIENQLKLQKPFVVYRKPNETMISGFFQKNNKLFFTEDFTDAGFVFAPFDNSEASVLLPENECDFYQEQLVFKEPMLQNEHNFSVNDSLKEAHVALVQKAIDSIAENQFQKVVVSRKETQNISSFQCVATYKKLLQKYKNAFGYVWYHPKVGLWLGATPETLLHISNNHFKTMSLAGTQVFTGAEKVTWQSKELEEQALVTSFIESQIFGMTVNLKVDEKETVKAGNLLHLRTNISGEIVSNKVTLKAFINALHPTPAVCGLPRMFTKEFILKNENYKRTFYTGFLGELNLQNKVSREITSSLFVNLRCMQIKDQQANIYIGGGVTKSSKALKEWEETVSKSKVMKAVL